MRPRRATHIASAMQVQQNLVQGLTVLRHKPFAPDWLIAGLIDIFKLYVSGVYEAQEVRNPEHAPRTTYHCRWIAFLPPLEHPLADSRRDAALPTGFAVLILTLSVALLHLPPSPSCFPGY